MNQNTEVIPGSPLYQKYSKSNKEAQYKDDLKLISAMCLQTMLGCQDGFDKETRTKYAIESAKELLKQLEAENE